MLMAIGETMMRACSRQTGGVRGKPGTLQTNNALISQGDGHIVTTSSNTMVCCERRKTSETEKIEIRIACNTVSSFSLCGIQPRTQ
jgi:hypothetical protein